MYVFEDLIRQVLCKFFLVNWKHTIATLRVRETLLQLILEICYSHISFNTLDPPAGYLSLWLFRMDRIALLYIAHPIRSSAPLYVVDCPRVPPPVNWTAGRRRPRPLPRAAPAARATACRRPGRRVRLSSIWGFNIMKAGEAEHCKEQKPCFLLAVFRSCEILQNWHCSEL